MLTLSIAAVYVGCFERGDRWLDPPAQPPVCSIGQQRCTSALERCELSAGAAAWVVVDDCAARELVCAPSLLRCTRCLPDTQLCEGQDVLACAGDGETTSYVSTCDTTLGSACRGGSCVALCAQAAVERMVAQGGGVVLNLCSIAAQMGLADRFAYSMTKGAVLTMTYSIAKDFIHQGVRCNCICPARVHTPFVDGYLARTYPGREAEMFEKLSAAQPIGRMARPDEVAALALYLCSDEAGFVTGCSYPLDGGAVNLR